ncbi:hypothetical protein [Mycobacterium parmense]|uniref:hypothetical protein n=1 Tax=Mycobacterium parmense TaxID=185642 RepID=UPI00111BE5EC|nr:hypothetical protein [Mycobacterium parmense]MCV7350919.1 hypothetical protein [Mycobacterium parmense]
MSDITTSEASGVLPPGYRPDFAHTASASQSLTPPATPRKLSANFGAARAKRATLCSIRPRELYLSLSPQPAIAGSRQVEMADSHPDRATARQIAAPLLAAVLVLVGSMAACSTPHPGSHASPPPAATASTDAAWAADDACENVEAQARLARYSELDFDQQFNTFNTASPAYDATRLAFIAAESNAVQQVSDALGSDVPDPPVGAIRAWLDAARALIMVLQSQSDLVTVYNATERVRNVYNDGIAEVCGPIIMKRDNGL